MKQNYELAKMAVAGLSARDRVEFMREMTGTPAAQEPDRLLRPATVAARLGCTKRTIFNLLASGALHRVKLPGRQRGAGVRESEVAALIGGTK